MCSRPRTEECGRLIIWQLLTFTHPWEKHACPRETESYRAGYPHQHGVTKVAAWPCNADLARAMQQAPTGSPISSRASQRGGRPPSFGATLLAAGNSSSGSHSSGEQSSASPCHEHKDNCKPSEPHWKLLQLMQASSFDNKAVYYQACRIVLLCFLFHLD